MQVIIEEEIYKYFRKKALKTIGPTADSLINAVLRKHIKQIMGGV